MVVCMAVYFTGIVAARFLAVGSGKRELDARIELFTGLEKGGRLSAAYQIAGSVLYTDAWTKALPSYAVDQPVSLKLEPRVHTVFPHSRRYHRLSRTPPTIVRRHGRLPTVSMQFRPQCTGLRQARSSLVRPLFGTGGNQAIARRILPHLFGWQGCHPRWRIRQR